MGGVIEDEIAVADAHPLGAQPFRRPDYIAKFRTLSDGIVPPAEQDRFIATVERLGSLTSGDLAGLTLTIDPALLFQRAASGIFDWNKPAGASISAPAETGATGRAPKKSVALSSVIAGNTAVCTVGQSGNDLHYRGYDIADLAANCAFEEVAYLLVYGSLPTAAELSTYKARLRTLRGLPAAVRQSLELLPAATHPMEVLRSGVSALGCVLPEGPEHSAAGVRDIADRLMASLGSMLLYWHHYTHNGRRIDVETDDATIGGHFLHLLHGVGSDRAPAQGDGGSLILYAEHEFNASTFTARSIASTGADV